jgi:hypothetical protein
MCLSSSCDEDHLFKERLVLGMKIPRASVTLSLFQKARSNNTEPSVGEWIDETARLPLLKTTYQGSNLQCPNQTE